MFIFVLYPARLRRDVDGRQSDVHVIEPEHFVVRDPPYRCGCALQRIIPEFSAAESGGYDPVCFTEHGVPICQFIRILTILAEAFDLFLFLHILSPASAFLYTIILL